MTDPFGRAQKNIAGPDQQIGGVLGTKMNAQGIKGLWTYAGGPGNAKFTDPTDPKSKVRVSRFGSYTFQWVSQIGECEVYDTVIVNFYIEFPQLEGEYYKPVNQYEWKEKPFTNVKSNFLNNQLTFQGETKSPTQLAYYIINTQGIIITEGQFHLTDNSFTHTIPSNLQAGIYFLVLKNAFGTSLNKFLVLN